MKASARSKPNGNDDGTLLVEEVEEVEADSKGPQKLKNVAEKSWYGLVEEVEEVEADSKGPQKLKNVAEKSWYGLVEEVEEVEADSKGPQKQHHL